MYTRTDPTDNFDSDEISLNLHAPRFPFDFLLFSFRCTLWSSQGVPKGDGLVQLVVGTQLERCSILLRGLFPDIVCFICGLARTLELTWTPGRAGNVVFVRSGVIFEGPFSCNRHDVPWHTTK